MALIHLFLDPVFHGVILLGVWIFFIYTRKTKWTNWAGIIFGTWFFLCVISPIPIYLVEQKERVYLPVDPGSLDTSLQYNILILGAGKISDPVMPYLTQLSGTVQRRLVEGIRIYRKLPNARIIGSASSAKSKTSQARTVAEAALELGVSTRDTLQLPSPVNTETEAKEYAKRFGTDNKLILVTSALHMPRAVYWFQRYGVDPIPAPCDYRIMEDPDDPMKRWYPSKTKLDFLGAWLHETVGLWYAKFKD